MSERPEIAPITITIKSAAVRLGCSEADVRRLCSSGRLRYCRIAGRLLIPTEYLKAITPADLAPTPRPERAPKPPPYIGDVVYFLEARGARLIKIGTSQYIASRLRGIRTGSPVPLHFLGCIAGNATDEQALHSRFAKYRKHGEWFRATPELRQFVTEALAERGLPINV